MLQLTLTETGLQLLLQNFDDSNLVDNAKLKDAQLGPSQITKPSQTTTQAQIQDIVEENYLLNLSKIVT